MTWLQAHMFQFNFTQEYMYIKICNRTILIYLTRLAEVSDSVELTG